MSHSLQLHGLYIPWNSPGQNTGIGSLSLLQEIFPTEELYPGLPHCRWILYQLSHQGSPIILEWVAYPFSSGSSWPRNWTRVSCIAGRFFTNWAGREAFFRYFTFIGYHRILSRVPFAFGRSLLFIYFIHSFFISLQGKTKVQIMADRLFLATSLPRVPLALPPAHSGLTDGLQSYCEMADPRTLPLAVPLWLASSLILGLGLHVTCSLFDDFMTPLFKMAPRLNLWNSLPLFPAYFCMFHLKTVYFTYLS